MLRKMKPVSFAANSLENVEKQILGQEINTTVPKSTDPVNFPVFDIPVGKRVLVYVPNHVYVDEAGVEHLRMDKPLLHSIIDGKRFLSKRCTQGLDFPENGISGECPLCEGVEDTWELANLQIEEKCKVRGLNPEDKENASVKNIRSTCFSNRVLKDSNRYYTFPIVVIETENDEGKKPVLVNGGINYKIMWYSISEAQYEKKWIPALDAMEDEPTHPGGNFFMLNYVYKPKTGEQNKRDAAQNLTVSHKNVFKDPINSKIKTQLDKATEAWTPMQAVNTVIANGFYSDEDLKLMTDDLLLNTRSMIELYKAKAVDSDTPAKADMGFNLEKKEETPEIPVSVGETDADFDLEDGLDEE